MGRGLGRVALCLGLVALAVAVAGVSALVIVDWQARGAEKVRVFEVPFTPPGSSALTAGRIIFINRDRAEDTDLLAHELVHVCQWEAQGIEFLWDYSTEYLKNVVELQDVGAAYVELSFEEEARMGEVDCEITHYLAPSR